MISNFQTPPPFVSDIVNEANRDLFIPEVAACLASICGTSPELAILGASGILGSIAGPSAVIRGEFDEIIRPHFSIFALGAEYAGWLRLQKLLLDPVAEIQSTLRELSAGINPKKLSEIDEVVHKCDSTKQLCEANEKTVEALETEASQLLSQHRARVRLRKPSFLLSSPSPSVFKEAPGDLMDRHATIVYPNGRLVENIVGGLKPSEWLFLLSSLADSLAGCDELHFSTGFGQIATLSATLVLTCPQRFSSAVFGGKFPGMTRLLHQCAIVCGDISEGRIESSLGRDRLQRGYDEFRRTVRLLLNKRRNAQAMEIELDAESRHLLARYSSAIVKRVADSDVLEQPELASALPWKIAWGLMVMRQECETANDCARYAVVAADATLAHQECFLRACRERAANEELQRQRQIMIKKISKIAPCSQRELMRTYRCQSGKIHGPVLEGLISDGEVERRDNLLVPRGFDQALELPGTEVSPGAIS